MTFDLPPSPPGPPPVTHRRRSTREKINHQTKKCTLVFFCGRFSSSAHRSSSLLPCFLPSFPLCLLSSISHLPAYSDPAPSHPPSSLWFHSDGARSRCWFGICCDWQLSTGDSSSGVVASGSEVCVQVSVNRSDYSVANRLLALWLSGPFVPEGNANQKSVFSCRALKPESEV